MQKIQMLKHKFLIVINGEPINRTITLTENGRKESIKF